MSHRNLRIIGCFLLAATGLLYQAAPVHAVAVYSLPSYGFVDLNSNPNQFASWDPDSPGGNVSTLTYRFAPSFTTDNRIRNQVRLAFDQWDSVANPGTKDSYYRNGGAQNFGDIRSIMAHEIGHALYAHHPDVGDNQVPKRNYDVTVSPPVVVADGNDEMMRSWVPRGAYNQILSHDELEGYHYVYGNRNLNFTEITSGAADILVSAGPESSSNTWAATRPLGVQRNAGDVTQGWRLTSAPINFNTISTYGMGFRTLGVNWDYQNTAGKATRGFEIRTRGTTNTAVISHYDGNAAQKFNTFSTSLVGDVNEKNDVRHTWGTPMLGGVPSDFPAGNVIHVGVEQDVWDWTVVSAQVVHPDGTRSNAPILGLHDWNQTVTGVAVTSSAGDGSEDTGIDMGGPLTIVAQGIELVNTKAIPTEIVSMGLAVVDKMGLQLKDLNRMELNRLMEAQRFELFDQGIGGTTLDNGQELFLVFDGDPTNIGNPIFLNRPDLVGHELFVYVETKDPLGEAIVGNYALLGTQPVTGVVPEPGTFAMAAIGLLCAFGYFRRRRKT